MQRLLQLALIPVVCAMLSGCLVAAAGAGAVGGLAVGEETSHKHKAPPAESPPPPPPPGSYVEPAPER